MVNNYTDRLEHFITNGVEGVGFLPNFLGQVNSDGEEQRDWLLFEWAGSKVNTSNRIFVQIRHLHIYTHTCSVCTTTTTSC